MQRVADDTLSPEAVRSLEEAIAALARAFRAYQLYLPNNPTRTAALERARQAFTVLWQHTPSVLLAISESSVHSGAHVIYQDEERGTAGLPWLMYRDGLRTLALTSGFEEGELDSFLDILHRSKTAPDDDDDLVTMLWVADFHCLDYRNVELVLDFDSAYGDTQGPGDESAAPPSATGAQLVESDMPDEGPPPAFVAFKDFESTLHFLNDSEITHLKQEVRREYSRDARTRVVEALFDIVESLGESAAQLEACTVLDRLLAEALADGSFAVAATILREARVAVARSGDRMDGRARSQLEMLSVRLSAADVIGGLLESIDQGGHEKLAPLLDDLFAELRPVAMVPLLEWYGSARVTAAHPPIERAISRLGSRHTAELVRLFDHHDAQVVRGAVMIARLVPSTAFVAPLGRILEGTDTRLRVSAVTALSAIASPVALQSVARLTEDRDRDVRIAALRTVAEHGFVAARSAVEQLLSPRAIRQADLTEKMAVFEAFVAVSGEDGVSLLDGLLNGRGLLGRREPAEVRACAAHALGRLGDSPLATAALERALGTDDIVVRSAVARALRREK